MYLLGAGDERLSVQVLVDWREGDAVRVVDADARRGLVAGRAGGLLQVVAAFVGVRHRGRLAEI